MLPGVNIKIWKIKSYEDTFLGDEHWCQSDVVTTVKLGRITK